jgi:hypothetical protein
VGWIGLLVVAAIVGGFFYAYPRKRLALGCGSVILIGCAAAFLTNPLRHGADLAFPTAALLAGLVLIGIGRVRPQSLPVRACLAIAPTLLLLVAIVTVHEIGEIVVLRIPGDRGAVHKTRLAVLDHGGATWVAAGSGGKRWVDRLMANPQFEFVRGGAAECRVAVPVYEPKIRAEVLRGLEEKYLIAKLSASLGAPLFYRDDDPEEAAIAIRLDPCSTDLPNFRR